MLKRLELSGFKSFAKPMVLEFPVPISAVVGPNGSGKSNVVEAIRWVLGEQSIKSLRGKKGEDLIFNGSETAPRLSKASVSLVFDNTKKILAVDYDEVKITRKVYRDNVNEYSVNGTRVRLKDVIEVLSGVGIGASSHYIINQGEADRILNSSAKERKQMIENALGLKIYQLKKNEAEKKLSDTEENIKQANSLKREIQPHLKYLKKQVDKSQESVALREQLKQLYREYFSIEDKHFEEEKKKILREQEGPKIELSKIQIEWSSLQGDDNANNGKQEIDIAKNQLAKKATQVNELQTRRNELERELGRFEGMIEVEKNMAEKMKEKTVSFVKINDFTKSVDAAIGKAFDAVSEKDFENIKEILNSIKQTINGFMLEISGGEVLPSSSLAELVSKKNDLVAMLSNLEKEEQNLLDQYNEAKNEVDKKVQAARFIEKEKYEKQSRFKELKSILMNLSTREESIKIQEEELERERHEAVALVGDDSLILISGELPYNINEQRILRNQIERIKIRLEDSGAISEEVIIEYDEVKNRDEFLSKELDDLVRSSSSLKELLLELEQKIDGEFRIGVKKINDEFKSLFVEVFGGGTAELKVVNIKLKSEDGEEEKTEEGVDVSVNLPKKKIGSLDMLSGGERALTSIALLFAMSQVKPPPFLVLDETDAALDEANSHRYANMLEKLSSEIQLIVITHNRETMSRAGVLYGVTMGSDSISKLLSIKFTEAEEYSSRY